MGHFAVRPHLPCMTELTIHDTLAVEATVRLAAEGDQVAFARLVAQHHASMARVAFVICGDPEMTRDAVQSAWAIAWRRLRTVRQPDQVRAWLVAVAANEARQALRRRRAVTVLDVSAALDASGGGDPADAIAVVDLRRVLRGLKPDDRALLALRFVAGLDSSEIATHLGGSASGIRSRLARLLDRMRTDLDDQDG
jgi:RNA polymerase sigma-70 factor, ECF subfamily